MVASEPRNLCRWRRPIAYSPGSMTSNPCLQKCASVLEHQAMSSLTTHSGSRASACTCADSLLLSALKIASKEVGAAEPPSSRSAATASPASAASAAWVSAEACALPLTDHLAISSLSRASLFYTHTERHTQTYTHTHCTSLLCVPRMLTMQVDKDAP